MYIRPITRDDHPQVAAITFEALKDDELYTWLYPNKNKYPDDLRRFQAIRLRYRLVSIRQLGLVVVTEESDPDWKGKPEVVGYAFLYRCGDDAGATKWKADTLFKKLERHLLEWELWYESKFLDRASDPARVKNWATFMPWGSYRSLDSRWHLSILTVSPKCQRRGIGGMLVKHGQKMAAEEGLPLSLESSVIGRGLYLKQGFKTVDVSEIVEGLDGVAMVWEPDGMRGTWLEDIGAETAKVRRTG